MLDLPAASAERSISSRVNCASTGSSSSSSCGGGCGSDGTPPTACGTDRARLTLRAHQAVAFAATVGQVLAAMQQREEARVGGQGGVLAWAQPALLPLLCGLALLVTLLRPKFYWRHR